MKTKPLLTIVKTGGNIIDDAAARDRFLADFAALDGHKILVHGGGIVATKTAASLGITPIFHEGRRITDAPMLDVAVMTYAGLINKTITAKLQALKANAVGLCGADGNLICAEKRPASPVDFGFAGDVTAINATMLRSLLLQDLVPVFSAITHDGNGQLLNTNADTVAGALAVALSADFEVKLLYCFEKKGVLYNSGDEDAVIPKITAETFRKLRHKGTIHSGMLPKLENCLEVASRGVAHVCIGGPALLQKGNSVYTQIMY